MKSVNIIFTFLSFLYIYPLLYKSIHIEYVCEISAYPL